MIEVRVLDLGRGALRDGQQFLQRGFALAALKLFVAFAKSFRDYAGHRLAGGFGDGLSEAVGFRVFDVEGHSSFYLSICMSTFLTYTMDTVEAI